MRAEVVLSPAEIASLPGREDMRGATCVVFDVLRATSTMLCALAHGAGAIYPVSTVEEARSLRDSTLPTALLGGERGGVRIDGFDLGNSPLEYHPRAVGGRDIVMTTTNGTIALQACTAASVIYAGALLNLDALAAAILSQKPLPDRLFLVCAGTGPDFALEDGLAAAGLLARLPPEYRAGDAATLLSALDILSSEHPLEMLRSSSNGRRLLNLGMGDDVDFCARVSVLDTVAVMRAGALRLRPVEP